MKTNKTLYWIGGIALTIGGVYILVNWYNKMQDAKRNALSQNAGTSPGGTNASTPPSNTNNSFLDMWSKGVVAGVNKIMGTYLKYKVVTQNDPLNVRQKPDASSVVVGKLPKDSIIYAKKSNVMGWMEVSTDGQKPLGFSSAAFLKYQA